MLTMLGYSRMQCLEAPHLHGFEGSLEQWDVDIRTAGTIPHLGGGGGGYFKVILHTRNHYV